MRPDDRAGQHEVESALLPQTAVGMSSRARVQAALAHRTPDRVPFDFGGTDVTGIHVVAYRALREYLGLQPIEPTIVDVFQQLAKVDQDLLDLMEVDVVNVSPRLATPYVVNDSGESYTIHDEYGIGWRMPKDGGWYYDMFSHPLAGDISSRDVDRFRWPDPLDPSRYVGFAEQAADAASEARAIVVCNLGSAGILEVYAWLRGFNAYFTDFVLNPTLACAILDKVVELKLAYWEHAIALAGDNIDVAQEGDDFAGQERLLISPDTYRRLVKPRHKAVFDYIHSNSEARVFFHSDGAIRDVIPDLIEIGVDILNPVQVSAVGMNSRELKRDFGRDLTFWGGGVDTQGVLGSEPPDVVSAEVRRRLEDLMPGGGFVFATVHNVQANVPPENIVAMWQTVREHGRY
jgi:uroporphyrinogen decarboxylase